MVSTIVETMILAIKLKNNNFEPLGLSYFIKIKSTTPNFSLIFFFPTM